MSGLKYSSWPIKSFLRWSQRSVRLMALRLELPIFQVTTLIFVLFVGTGGSPPGSGYGDPVFGKRPPVITMIQTMTPNASHSPRPKIVAQSG